MLTSSGTSTSYRQVIDKSLQLKDEILISKNTPGMTYLVQNHVVRGGDEATNLRDRRRGG